MDKKHIFRKINNYILIIALGFVILVNDCRAQPAQEYQVKAVFVYNFSNFIIWPPSAFSEEDSPFFICILGADPFERFIDEATENHKAKGHPVIVERIRQFTEHEHSKCHILFISRSESRNLQKLLVIARSYPILLVSDIENFAKQAGMIELVVNPDKKVRLIINLCAVEQVGLRADANLLKLSTIVQVCQN